MRVHDRWDRVIVDMTVALRDVFNRGDGFLFRLVCEHGAKSTITNDADMWELGAILLIDDEPAFVVDIKANIFKTETGGVGPATNGYKDNIRV